MYIYTHMYTHYIHIIYMCCIYNIYMYQQYIMRYVDSIAQLRPQVMPGSSERAQGIFHQAWDESLDKPTI